MHSRLDPAGPTGVSVRTASASGSSGSENNDSTELPSDFFADLDVWFAGSGGAMADPLLTTPPVRAPSGPVGGGDVLGSPVPAPVAHQKQPQPLPWAQRSQIKPKSSTQRQKEELQYLRGKAAELETQLQTLKRSHEPSVTSAAEAASDTGDGWKDVAKRQRTERSKAEEENAQLIRMLQHQIRLARGLERLLGKREVWDQLQEGHWRKSDLEGQADDQVFTRLQQNVNVRCSMLDAAFRSSGLDGATEDVDETKLNYTSADGVVFKSRHVKLTPFDSRAVEDVVWRSFREGRVKLANDHVMIVKESPDFVLAKAVVQEPPMIMKPATVFQAMRRLTGARCTYMVCEFTALTEGSMGVGYPPFQITVRVWGRIQSAKLADGSAGSVLNEISTTTLAIVDSRSSPTTTDMTVDPGTHREISILTRLLASLIQQKRASILQVIENLVVDATLAAKHV